ncbi:hypothetical protein M8J77_002582 [Diaphorina citri]|nr:hypothetical protein M8J77_002582 [Diaphorina citri]
MVDSDETCPDISDSHFDDFAAHNALDTESKPGENANHHELQVDPRYRTLSFQDQDCDGVKTLYFTDQRRKIDLVLVYEDESHEGFDSKIEEGYADERTVFRQKFEESLIKEGLETEVVPKEKSFDTKTTFIKIHVPLPVIERYAEVMNLKMPVKRLIPISVKAWEGKFCPRPKKSTKGALVKLFNSESELSLQEPSFYAATSDLDREEQFVVKERDREYTSAQRSQIAWQILTRAKYGDENQVGIRRLINNNTYSAVFPLHEGCYNRDEYTEQGELLDRRLLFLEWARASKWNTKQPLCLVRKYFGDKIALYFAWLGFYTFFLAYPAVIGLLCFAYGVMAMNSDENTPSKEICDINIAGNITLCPLCDKACQYQKLGDSCIFSKITFLFDNSATLFFSIFMSFWATTFLELWKRRQAVIAWEWDLQNAEDDEEPRPEFESSVKTFRTNPVTRRKEPYMPTADKSLRFAISAASVLFMILVVLAAVLGTIIYRLSIVAVMYEGGNTYIKTHAKIFTSISAAIMNLIIIMILTKFYHHLALYLTNLENPRTQTEYENSFTFKIFVFEFMNYYSSLIYIAFFKGRFYSHPGDSLNRNQMLSKLKGDVCDPAGCLSELCIQLAIIMIGKQCFNNFLEFANPAVVNWWRKRSQISHTKDKTRRFTRWEQDYQLQDPGRLALFEEYLEMVIQYGFVTLFVAAFPLAPLFALLNNIGEIRLDAFKMVTQARRPLAERVENIGAWYGVLQGITYLAVVSNGFVIAYTSDYIPRIVYKYLYSNSTSLVGYIDSSLSLFNTSDYMTGMGVDRGDLEEEPETCQYRGYRNGPDHGDQYGLSPQYWHVFAARLAFVVIFEHIIFALTGLMAYIIPDVPSELKTQIKRERLLMKEAQYEHTASYQKDNDEYDDLLNAIRNSRSGTRLSDVIEQKNWARRMSQFSFASSSKKSPFPTVSTLTVAESVDSIK